MRDLALAQIDGLSSRAINCCNDVGIATLGDLFDFIRNKSLMTIKHCGVKTANELGRIITAYENRMTGYKYNLFAVDYADEDKAPALVLEESEPATMESEGLGAVASETIVIGVAEELEAVAAEPQAAYEAIDYDNVLPDSCIVVNMSEYDEVIDSYGILQSLNETYLESLDESHEQLAEKVKDKFPSIESILLLVSQQPEGLLSYYSDWTIEDHFKFWEFCKDLISEMTAEFDEAQYPSLHNSLNRAYDYICENMKSKKLTLMRARLRELAAPLP